MIASCLYEGTLRHRRFEVRQREFTHRLALAYIDLDEIETLLHGRLVKPTPGLLRFRREDYFGDPSVPLAVAVRERLARELGRTQQGPIRVLTQLRSYGHCFNPISFYYCMAEDGKQVRAMLGEVTNTPWGERHSYVLDGGEEPHKVIRGAMGKQLHVSPFFGMDHTYTWRASTPGETLSVHIENHRAGAKAFDATLALRRRELTRASAARLSARYPFANLRVLALIYAHALGLKLAGVTMHRKPGRVGVG